AENDDDDDDHNNNDATNAASNVSVIVIDNKNLAEADKAEDALKNDEHLLDVQSRQSDSESAAAADNLLIKLDQHNHSSSSISNSMSAQESFIFCEPEHIIKQADDSQQMIVNNSIKPVEGIMLHVQQEQEQQQQIG